MPLFDSDTQGSISTLGTDGLLSDNLSGFLFPDNWVGRFGFNGPPIPNVPVPGSLFFNQIVADGATGYWPLDEVYGGQVRDFISPYANGSGFGGAVSPNFIQLTHGSPIRRAPLFTQGNGASFVFVSTTTKLVGTQGSFSMCVAINKLASPALGSTIFSFEDASSNPILNLFWDGTTANQLDANVFFSTAQPSAQLTSVANGTHLIHITYNDASPQTVTIYIDGGGAQSSNTGGGKVWNSVTSNGALVIGSDQNGANNVGGSIGDVAYFPGVVLSSGQVATEYAAWRTYGQTMTGAMNFAGLATKKAVKTPFTGSIASAGSIIKKALKSLSGSETPSGVIHKLTNKVFAGLPYNPSTVAGLQLWLDAADQTTITLATGVSQWNDKSGQGNNVAQATGSLQPTETTINGLNAILFNGSTQYLAKATSTLPSGSGPAYSVVYLATFAPSPGNNGAVVSWGDVDSGGASGSWNGSVQGNGAGNYDGVSDNFVTAALDTAPHVVVVTYAGGTLTSNTVVWTDGTSGTLTSFGSSTPSIGSSPPMKIGCDTGALFDFYTGAIGEATVFSGVLGTTDRQAMEGYVAWKWGTQANLPGGHPYAAHPPGGTGGFIGAVTSFITNHITGGGGTTHFLSISGSITPAGAMTWQLARLLAGSETPAGALTKQTSRHLTGSETPAGALTKQTSRNLTGSETPAGSLAKQIARLLTGSETPAGSLTKQTHKSLTASETPAGSLTKKTSRAFTGSETPIGTLLKQAQLVFTASITAAGSLSSARVRVWIQALSGSITPAGAITKQVNAALAGSITPSGAFTRFIAANLAGSIIPVGTLTKKTSASLAGSLTPSGSLVRNVAVALAGSITPAGALTKLTSVALAGHITPTGSITRGFFALLSGSITPVGTIPHRTITRNLAAVLGPIGVLSRSFPVHLSASIQPVGTLTKQAQVSLAGAIQATSSLAHQILENIIHGVVNSFLTSYFVIAAAKTAQYLFITREPTPVPPTPEVEIIGEVTVITTESNTDVIDENIW